MPTGIYKRPEGFKGNLGSGFLGKRHSEITKDKLRKIHLGKKLSKEHREKLSKVHKGKQMHPNTRKALLEANIGNKYTSGLKGKLSGAWRGGTTTKNHNLRSGTDFLNWRESVFKRDNYTCQKYGIRGGILHPHHIKNFSSNPELMFEVANGITLSKKAHNDFHKKYGYRNNTREQL